MVDILIRREVDAARLAAITPNAAAAEDEGFEGNRSYQDLRHLPWAFVAEALDRERTFIARLCSAADIDAEADRLEEERIEEFDDPLWGLDVGVAGSTLALSALGCTPFYSCNGGVLGGSHATAHPLVAFYLPLNLVDSLLLLAEAADAGMLLDEYGRARLYAGDVGPMLAFAEAAITSHRA